jgi:hypothetical protein
LRAGERAAGPLKRREQCERRHRRHAKHHAKTQKTRGLTPRRKDAKVLDMGRRDSGLSPQRCSRHRLLKHLPIPFVVWRSLLSQAVGVGSKRHIFSNADAKFSRTSQMFASLPEILLPFPATCPAVASAKEDAGVPGVFLGAPSRINAAGYCVTLLVMQ